MDRSVQVNLKDGTPVIIRPVRPEDKSKIVHGMHLLSPQSRHLRFFTDNAELSSEMLRYLTEVDQQNHVAWIALDASSADQQGIGIARFVRLPKEPTTAEPALTVIDPCRSLGLGRHLMNVLRLRAQELGVNKFRALVLPENRLMLDWMERMGASNHFNHGLYECDLPLNTATPGSS